MSDERMFAMCLDDRDCDLKKGAEYEVAKVTVLRGFGEALFYVLANGRKYASCHFTVTYMGKHYSAPPAGEPD